MFHRYSERAVICEAKLGSYKLFGAGFWGRRRPIAQLYTQPCGDREQYFPLMSRLFFSSLSLGCNKPKHPPAVTRAMHFAEAPVSDSEASLLSANRVTYIPQLFVTVTAGCHWTIHREIIVHVLFQCSGMDAL